MPKLQTYRYPKYDPPCVMEDFELDVLDVGRTMWSALVDGHWSVTYFYRSEWCPYCNAYFERLGEAREDCERAGLEWVAISTDDEAASSSTRDRHGLTIPIAYGADLQLGKSLDLFVNPAKHCFEPSFIVCDPQRRVRHVVLVSGPFARPAPLDFIETMYSMAEFDARGEPPGTRWAGTDVDPATWAGRPEGVTGA